MYDGIFSPTVLRFATVFGSSPRMRFDLVVNVLTAKAINDGKITVFGGDQWRPLVDVADISRAITLTLEAPAEKVAGEVFNVGGSEINHTINDIGSFVKELIPEAQLVIEEKDVDKRNYRVNFSKIKDVLGFVPALSVKDGIREMAVELRTGKFKDYTEDKFSNYKTYVNQNLV